MTSRYKTTNSYALSTSRLCLLTKAQQEQWGIPKLILNLSSMKLMIMKESPWQEFNLNPKESTMTKCIKNLRYNRKTQRSLKDLKLYNRVIDLVLSVIEFNQWTVNHFTMYSTGKLRTTLTVKTIECLEILSKSKV